VKVVINDAKTGNSFQKELAKEQAAQLLGKKIGGELDGGLVGLPGYKLVIKGGSDSDGVPMRGGVSGARRASIISGKGVGVREARKGDKIKKRVVGSMVSERIAQLNACIKEYGAKPLAELGFTPKSKVDAKAGAGAEAKVEAKVEFKAEAKEGKK